MKKTNKSYTLTLSVEYMPIHTDGNTLDTIALTDDDIYATDWLHQQGYKASIEGNTLVISKDWGWGSKSVSRYVIIPDIQYHDYREKRNYIAIIDTAKRLAMAHTLAIVRKINSGR